ncbi:hypothetical protein AVEN_216684-1 [Araneus ventricosus]|uniref:Tesmin/TSO1-like CXC domain-containing protein n=1 Tax=Araneus ventricosus TaxID=182803 RepID=A0A4Y2DTT2_ARAVE|nr:hypothetical protein AVEN_216684-1 [Araneus ventricosus]
MGLEGNKAKVAPFHINSRTSPRRNAYSTAYKCSKGCRNACGCRKQRMKCSSICFNCRGALRTNVPENIKNRPKLDDDVIISDDEAVLKNFWMKMLTTALSNCSFCSSPHQKMPK